MFRRMCPLWWSVIILLCIVQSVLAQSNCATLVETALNTAKDSCEGLGRNQVCYGNITLEASPRANAPEFRFEQTGDIVDIAAIESLRLSSMSLVDEIWGISIMQIQANVPDTLPGQNVTFVLFGNVEILNAGDNAVELAMTPISSVNVRLRPRTDQENVMLSLIRGQQVTANGRLADNSWIRIEVEGDARGAGWVATDFLTTEGDINTLSVVVPGQPRYGPMQAFYMSTSIGDSTCTEVPDSGILIQTPQGVGEINLLVNEVSIQLGSTAYLQAGGGYLITSVLEGQAILTANGVTQAVPAGTFSRVALDANGAASGTPEFPQPYDEAQFAALPLSLLGQPITISPALTETEVTAAVEEAQAAACDGFYPVESVWYIDTRPDLTITIIPYEPCDSILWRDNQDGGIGGPHVRIAPSTYQWEEYFEGQLLALWTFTFTSETTMNFTYFRVPENELIWTTYYTLRP